MKAQSNSPWLDQNGKILSNEKIRSISKEWSAETWEEFLKSTVEVEALEQETLTQEYEKLCEKQKESVWGPSCSLPQGVQDDIHCAVKKLEERPRKIIRRSYWENKSVREIAAQEILSKSRVQEIKMTSLNQIKEMLVKAPDTSSYLIGGSKNFNLPKNREEEINEVYRVDLEGSYLK